MFLVLFYRVFITIGNIDSISILQVLFYRVFINIDFKLLLLLLIKYRSWRRYFLASWEYFLKISVVFFLKYK